MRERWLQKIPPFVFETITERDLEYLDNPGGTRRKAK
jgi:hypothetical protein